MILRIVKGSGSEKFKILRHGKKLGIYIKKEKKSGKIMNPDSIKDKIREICTFNTFGFHFSVENRFKICVE